MGGTLKPITFLWCSLLVLRLQLAMDGASGNPQIFFQELTIGAGYDLAVALMAVELSRSLKQVLKPRWFSTLLAAGVIILTWLCSLASMLYFRFFRSKLDLWVIKNHWHELLTVRGSVAELSSVWTVIVAGLFLAIAVATAVRTRNLFSRPRLVAIGRFSSVVLLVFGLLQLPVWARKQGGGGGSFQDSVFQSQPLIRWWKQAASKSSGQDLSASGIEALAQDSRAFFELSPAVKDSRSQPRARRRLLGLPEDGPVHIILLVVESLRDFEFNHPVYKRHVFPELHALAEKHAIRFQQVYSSALDVGQSARGVYSLNCSMLPNLGGIAPHIGFEDLRQRCLAEELKSRGYRTIWLNGVDKNFQNRFRFESRHGFSEFYDKAYFESLGPRDQFNLGIGDEPFLEVAHELFEKAVLRSPRQPVLMMPLTLSTHHPPLRVSGVRMEGLEEKFADRPAHLAHFSQLKYFDRAGASLIRKVFDGPQGDRTLVVLVGDHSITFPSAEILSSFRQRELYSRTPLLFLTRNMPAPTVRQAPAHQIDVAPTILGLLEEESRFPAEWLGRNLLSYSTGSPSVYAGDSGIFFRVGDLSCSRDQLAPVQERQLRCFRIPPGSDPLWDPVSEESKDENWLEMERRAWRSTTATHSLIENDLLHQLQSRK